MTSDNVIDMLIHIDTPQAKDRLRARLAECPGVFAPRITTLKPQLMFVCHDPARFNIKSVPDIARSLGIKARIIEV